MKKKLLSMLFLIITLFSTAHPIFATTMNYGTQNWVAGQYDSKMYTTDSKTNVGIIIRRLTNYNTGEKITTFCAEHYIESTTGTIETGTHSMPTDPLIKKACVIAYFGWYSRYGSYAVDGGILTSDFINVKESYVFTQQYIWEVLGQSTATFIDNEVQSRYISFKNEIEQKIANIKKTPSFSSEKITLEVGTTTTLTDTNGVLKDYCSIDKTVNGIRILHNYGENTMQVIIDENCTLQTYEFTSKELESYGLIKEETKNHNTTVYITFREGVQNQLYSMNYNEPVSMTLNLKINSYGNLELSKLSEDGDLIDGAIFKIEGKNYFKEVTVTNGKIVLDNLKKGDYTITEIHAPKGYLLDKNTYKIEIKPNQTSKQVIVNKEPTGTFTLIKKNADKTATLEGTTYRIWNEHGYDKQFSTNKEGKIIITGLKLGSYNYQEIKATNGYLIDTKIYSFKLEYKDQYTSVINVSAEKTNEEPKGTITIIKKDIETGSKTQGNATFLNAKYKVYAEEDIYNKAKTIKYYSKGDLVATRSMNKNGTTEIVEQLPLGRYKIKEDISSEGYLIDSKEYKVNLEYQDQNTKIVSQTITSYEQVKKMQVHIFKSGIRENSGLVAGLQGAEFTIKLNSDVDNAYLQGYTYEEVWNGINKNGNKVNVDIERAKEAQKIAPTYEIIKTDSNGNAYTQKKLPYGKYIVKETITPIGYKTANDFTFSITQDESEINEIAKKVKHLVVNNEQLETYIKLIKKDSKTDKIVTFSSSTFEIKAIEDIYDKGAGKIIYKKGENIKQKVGNTIYSSFTTNADNILIPNGSYSNANDKKGSVITPLVLPAGAYEIIEVKTPEGFLQLNQPITFKIENDENNIKEIVVKNEQPTATLIIDKSIILREDVDKSLIDIKDLSEIMFKLIAQEEIKDFADGSIIYKKGEIINTYNLDKKGKLKIENLPLGKYNIQEIKTLDGLVLNDKKYEVEFKQNDVVTKEYKEVIKIENMTTIVEISKQDIRGEKELEGAKLVILNENNEVIDTWISDGKTHKIEGLIVGKTYILREEYAPKGYTISEDIRFTVSKDTQLIKMIDNPIIEEIPTIQTGVAIKKTSLVSIMGSSVIGIMLGVIILKRLI